jgi:hypothetical protein
MYGTRATRARVPYYRCSAPDGGCGVVSIRAEKLERYVAAECELHHAEENGGPIQGDGTDEREAELGAALVEAEARAINIRKDYADGAIDARTLREALATIDKRALTLRRELADVVRSQPSYGAFAEPVDFDEERAHYAAAIERVEVSKTERNPRVPAAARVSITWKRSA